jgi:hypothetical protein
MTPMFLTLNEAASALQLHPVTRPVSRELFDPARQRGGSMHGGTRKHVAASGESAVMDPSGTSASAARSEAATQAAASGAATHPRE